MTALKEEKLEEITDSHEWLDSELREEDSSAWQCKAEMDRQRIRDMEQNRSERSRYAKLSFALICAYLAIVLVFVGCSRLIGLTDPVVITLLTTTTATVFGIFLCVMRYLFPHS